VSCSSVAIVKMCLFINLYCCSASQKTSSKRQILMLRREKRDSKSTSGAYPGGETELMQVEQGRRLQIWTNSSHFQPRLPLDWGWRLPVPSLLFQWNACLSTQLVIRGSFTRQQKARFSNSPRSCAKNLYHILKRQQEDSRPHTTMYAACSFAHG